LLIYIAAAFNSKVALLVNAKYAADAGLMHTQHLSACVTRRSNGTKEVGCCMRFDKGHRHDFWQTAVLVGVSRQGPDTIQGMLYIVSEEEIQGDSKSVVLVMHGSA
jgi:hypothetical protein